MGRTDFADADHAGKMALPLQNYLSTEFIEDIRTTSEA